MTMLNAMTQRRLEDDSQEGYAHGEFELTWVVPAPEAERYQLLDGSPRHSPTVTAL